MSLLKRLNDTREFHFAIKYSVEWIFMCDFLCSKSYRKKPFVNIGSSSPHIRTIIEKLYEYKYLYVQPSNFFPLNKKKGEKLYLEYRLEKINREIAMNISVASKNKKEVGYVIETSRICIKEIINLYNHTKSSIMYNKNNKSKHVSFCTYDLYEHSENIRNLQDVEYLKLCCNFLDHIKPEFAYLRNLKYLTLSNNRLKNIPDEIGRLHMLVELNLSSNYLETFPKTIIGLWSLETLRIDNNAIKELPQFLGKLESLKRLDISKNPISAVPAEIFQISSLLEFVADLPCRDTRTPIITKMHQDSLISLMECISRCILRKNIDIKENTLDPIKTYLRSVRECSFCKGPFFDYFFKVEIIQKFSAVSYPFIYYLCSLHFRTEEEIYYKILRDGKLETNAYGLEKKGLPSVSQLFCKVCFNERQHKYYVRSTKIKKKNGSDVLVPLITLAE